MIKGLQAFMQRPTTWVGILIALMFQVIFSVIWMTGYDGVTSRVDQLRIGVVNEDQQLGTQVSAALIQNLPFDMVQNNSLENAKEQLHARELQMVVFIGADFSQKAASTDGTASIQYFINESNPALIKSIMSGAAEQITTEVNRQAVAQGVQTVLGSMNVPAEQSAIVAQGLSQRVSTEVVSSNAVEGMSNQMVPMMLVLASYVGAMLMAMNLQQSAAAVGPSVGRWQQLAVRSSINIVASVLISLVGSSLIAAFGGQMEQGFLHMWLFQALFMLTFMFTAQMFLYVFGMAGMLFNIIMLSAQLVSSGAIVPRELLSDFYVKLGDMLPATYAVEGTMNILFGGPSIRPDALALLVIAAAAFVISVLMVTVKRQIAPAQQSAAIAAKR